MIIKCRNGYALSHSSLKRLRNLVLLSLQRATCSVKPSGGVLEGALPYPITTERGSGCFLKIDSWRGEGNAQANSNIRCFIA